MSFLTSNQWCQLTEDKVMLVLQVFYTVRHFQDKLEELMIPRLVIPAGRKPHIVQYVISKKLQPVVQQRYSMFERVYSVSVKVASKLLDSGYKLMSRFGHWCPVAVRPSALALLTFCTIQ